ncbi:glycoside hydrolase family 57 [Kordiimonas lipolytica]|uniref:Glycoside hydrolase family 57 n=1 Tax=Kordiimonas lipolytica TaxID=1662421 RepID=A0ABV8UEI9_9PROT|nr:hypothetical protein [Kordiimonas lipolytica]
MPGPILYTVFHLNLAFSSVEVEERKTVVERCYWPLLRLAQEEVPIGLEVTSFTLLEVQKIDPDWVKTLKILVEEGKVELIGSGFCQIIGPLVPAELTRQNLKLGLDDYEALLGCRPTVALINEQAYSSGLLPLYKEAGFDAVMMDWAEPASHNKNWEKTFSQRPQMIAGACGTELPVIWSDAISFQKFQRYAHGELTAEEYFGFLSEQINSGAKAIPVYTSDAEVFDYRPGRFAAEAQLEAISEFERIRLLLTSLKKSDDVVLALPREALAALEDGQSPPLRLDTSAVPVPVKKQRKYNLTRWGLTGRADLKLNTHCWRLYEGFADGTLAPTQNDWRQLCQMWASDYRTHITGKRWLELADNLPAIEVREPEPQSDRGTDLPPNLSVQRVGRFLSIEGDGAHLVLNMQRGLAIQSFGLGAAGVALSGKLPQEGVIGTLAHGFFEDIAYGADFYSGHFVIEPALSHKVTDLAKCEPEVACCVSTGQVEIIARIAAGGSRIHKTIRVDLKARTVDISYECNELMAQAASKRLGFVTLNPDFFDRKTLFYATHNGGEVLERYPLFRDGELVTVDHGAPVSRLVSASSALGTTEGRLYLGDADHYVCVEMKRADCAGLGMVACAPVRGSFFLRGYMSVGELDETSKFDDPGLDAKIAPMSLRQRISLGKTAKLL